MSSEKRLKNREDEKVPKVRMGIDGRQKTPPFKKGGVHWSIKSNITRFLSWML